jgi:hypothetical protein
LRIDYIFHVLVDHFWRPIHHSGILLKILHHVVKMIGRALRWIKRLSTRRPKITELKALAAE